MRLKILALVLMLVIAGCTAQPAEQQPAGQDVQEPAGPDAAPERQTTEPDSRQANESADIPEGQFEPPAEEIPTIKKFHELYTSEVKNYQFKYNTNTYKVKENIVKIELDKVLRSTYNAPFIDTVYLDRQRRTAIGVCEGTDRNIRSQCMRQEILKKKFAVPYLQFAVKLPDDWLTELINLPFVPADRPMLSTGRPNVHLKYTSASKNTDLYIDPASGLPIAVIDNTKEYHYQNLAKNTVTENFLVE